MWRSAVVPVVAMVALAPGPIGAAAATGKTTLRLFYSDWCFPLCGEPVEAATELAAEIKADDSLRGKYEVVLVDCSRFSKSFVCCQHDVKAFPAVHITPADSTSFWIFQGERNLDQMRFALINDGSPKAMVKPRTDAGRLSCGLRATKYSVNYILTRTIGGSAVLGAAIGGLLVYVYIASKAIRFGSRRGDFAVLAGTVIVTYYLVL